MYICNECSQIFDEPSTIKTTYEQFYGVASEFSNSTPFYMEVCPYCQLNDFEFNEIDEEEEDIYE